MTKGFGTALACIAFTSYLNPIMPIAGERHALKLLAMLLHVDLAPHRMRKQPSHRAAEHTLGQSPSCLAAPVGEDDDKTALKTNGQGGTKLGKQKQKPAAEADDTPRKKGKK